MTAPRRAPQSMLPERWVRADASVGPAGSARSGAAGLLDRLAPSSLVSAAGRRPFPLAPPDWPESIPRPEPEGRLGVDYDTEWSRRYGVRLARAVLLDNVARPIARVLASPLVRGEESLVGLPTPVIFAANHVSHADTPLLLTSLPRRFRHRTVVAAAADYFFDRRWKAAAWSFLLAAIPIERVRVNRRSVQLASDLVADGWNLVIFPEGSRSPDGWAGTFSGGAAYLALRTGTPVVPVHLEGTRRLIPKGGNRLRPTRTTVTFGIPLRPRADEDARRFGARVEAAIAAMADEVTSDWWTARLRATSGTTPPLQGPAVGAWRRSWALDDESPEPDRGSERWPRPASARRGR
ncbi:MAG TPA: lysophospholipid acyltransferase family protein [Acidimicrobiales bacterium]|nr:lysophospholipid acyltransferase family protein [Acidimicrobiales bacterium]